MSRQFAGSSVEPVTDAEVWASAVDAAERLIRRESPTADAAANRKTSRREWPPDIDFRAQDIDLPTSARGQPRLFEGARCAETPQDLLRHRLLSFSYDRPEGSWTFVHVNGKDQETLTFQPHLTMNDFAGLTPALLAGGGIGDLPPVVQPELVRDGRLVEVMPNWRFRTLDLSLVHLGNRHMPKAVRVFKEFAVQMATLFQNLPT